MKKLIAILIFVCALTSVFANRVDSMYTYLEGEVDEIDRIHTYNSLSRAITDNADTSLFYAHEALKLSKKINHRTYLVNSYLSLSNINLDMGSFKKALKDLFTAQGIADSLGNNELLGKIYNNLGNAYRGMENIESSEKFYARAIKLYESTGNELELGKTYNNIALIYVRQEKYDEAIKAYHNSLDIVKKFKDKSAEANGWSNLGVAHYYKGELEKTIFYFKKSLKIEQEINNLLGVAISYSNIGELYSETRNFDAAIENLLLSIETAKKVNAQDLLKHTYQILSMSYAKLDNFKMAYKYNQLFTNLKDSINDIETSKFSMELESKFASSEKEKKILALEKQQVTNELELTEKKYTQNLLIGGVVIFFLLLLLFYVRYRSSKKSKEILQLYSNEIEQKNSEITDSITYAKRIQEAILPPLKNVNELLPNSFIFYKPKDIVAGDFYWIDAVDDYVLFAAADCTGHGVPGAMMSVVCHNTMNRVIREFKLLDPAKILGKTRELIVDQLNKFDKEAHTLESIRDGMDIALCVLDLKTNQLQYAGAYNPLWILRNEGNEIEEIKANKQAIGKVDNPQPYTTHEVQLNKGDSIYVFSDGFADQFGGEKGKKFKSRPFKKLLTSLRGETMGSQLRMLGDHFETWKGDLEQVDDVCVKELRFNIRNKKSTLNRVFCIKSELKTFFVLNL